MSDITSSNAKLILTVEELFPAGIELHQFATDQSYTSDAIVVAETRMGVDGFMAAGMTPTIAPVTIVLEASSPTNKPFSLIHKAMTDNHKIYPCELIARIPSIGVTMTWHNGTMVSGTPVPSGKKVLDPTQWVFHFESYDRSVV